MANVLDRIGSNIKKTIQDNKKEKGKEIKVSSNNEVLILENNEFDYTSVDLEISEFLKNSEITIKNIFAKAYTDLGRVLSEAQNRLSSHHGGVFEKWYNSLGFKKDKVYRLISRYNLVLANCDNRDLIENMPLSLSYEISKESCEPKLKDMVLNGEIKTLREFKEVRDSFLINESVIEVKDDEVDEENIFNKIELIDDKYKQLRHNVLHDITKYEKEKKEKILREISLIEKKIEKLLKNI